MPNLPDAAVLLTGSVFTLELVTDYETKAPNGARVSVLAAGGGAAVVKLTKEALQLLAPVTGDQIAWYVRNSPWTMEGSRSGMSTVFVRVANEGDLDAIHSTVTAKAAK